MSNVFAFLCGNLTCFCILYSALYMRCQNMAGFINPTYWGISFFGGFMKRKKICIVLTVITYASYIFKKIIVNNNNNNLYSLK